MVLTVLHIEEGAAYQEKVYNYFIEAQTLSGRALSIFDSLGWSKTLQVSDRIDAEISCYIDVTEASKALFTGILEKENDDYKVITQDGILMILPEDHIKAIPLGTTIFFNIAGNCSASHIEKLC